MIKKIIEKIQLINKCTLVEAEAEENKFEYEGNTYKAQKVGAIVKFSNKTSEEEMVKHLEHRLFISLLKEAGIEITNLIEEENNKLILLTKDDNIKLKENESILCNSATAEKLKDYNIDSTKIVLTNAIEDNKMYVLDLKNILFFYCNNCIEIGNLKDLYRDVTEEENTITKYIDVYANFYLDKNKVVDVTEIYLI